MEDIKRNTLNGRYRVVRFFQMNAIVIVSVVKYVPLLLTYKFIDEELHTKF